MNANLFFVAQSSQPCNVVLLLFKQSTLVAWRPGGLMVRALDSRSSNPGLDIVLCSWERNFTLTVPLSTQVYKWVPANLMLGVNSCDGLAFHLGGVEILLVVS